MANETPESDFSIECFQNYTAPEVFVQGLAGMVDQTDVETIIRAQKNMLQRFEKTTEMLTNCNQLSASRLRAASIEFRKHTQLLLEMRKDLEFVFKKIRAIKTKLRHIEIALMKVKKKLPPALKKPLTEKNPATNSASTQYPEAYKTAVTASLANRKPIDEEEDFKPTESHTESKMVATVSTETLKPTVSEDRKKKKEVKIKTPKLVEVSKKSRNSSSSETESASSGDDSSTDTG